MTATGAAVGKGEMLLVMGAPQKLARVEPIVAGASGEAAGNATADENPQPLRPGGSGVRNPSDCGSGFITSARPSGNGTSCAFNVMETML